MQNMLVKKEFQGAEALIKNDKGYFKQQEMHTIQLC